MKEFHVYHSPIITLHDSFNPTRDSEKAERFWAENREGFKHVAVVDAENLDEVYQLTNHIDCAWWDNDEVKLTGEETRATSLGDVILQIDDDGATMFMVAKYGFVEIGK